MNLLFHHEFSPTLFLKLLFKFLLLKDPRKPVLPVSQQTVPSLKFEGGCFAANNGLGLYSQAKGSHRMFG